MTVSDFKRNVKLSSQTGQYVVCERIIQFTLCH